MNVSTRGLRVQRGGHLALDDVSVTVQPHALTALLGPNGAGKSTLIAALSGDVVPDAGEVLLGGRGLAAWSAAELARHRAVLPQHARLAFDFSVREIVRMGRAPFAETLAMADRHVDSVLTELSLHTFADRGWASLSGGERQRVQLARVLAQIHDRDDPVLFLDEPTNHLDIRQRFAVLAMLRQLASTGVTVVAVLHDLDLAARFAHAAVLLKRGRVLAQGPVDAVLTPDNLLAAFDLPMDLVRDPASGVRLPVPRWPGQEAS